MKTAIRQVLLASRAVALSLDADAAAYIAAVEAADGAALETATKSAINTFVLGCKADGIWTAIQNSCILAGARTLSGALVPLKGTAPTNLNFVSGDYNRATGLVGNGTNKELNTNRAHNSYTQNDFHSGVWISSRTATTSVFIGAGPLTNEIGASNIGYFGSNYFVRNQISANLDRAATTSTNFMFATSRTASASWAYLVEGNLVSANSISQTPFSGNMFVFSSGAFRTDARLAFYTIGSALNLTMLNNRVSTLIASFAGLT